MQNLMKHLLGLEFLLQDQIIAILDCADYFFRSFAAAEIQSGPSDRIAHPGLYLGGFSHKQILSDKIVMNLFFEESTRTRSSFEIAAKRLGADVINFNIETSSAKKGETLLDTVDNLSAMNADLFIVRHKSSGAPHYLSRFLKTDASIINAGDGCHEHPSQGLLDLFAIRYYKKKFEHLKVAIVGDILHSRVARSLIHGLTLLSTREICVVGPKTLIPPSIEKFGVNVFYTLEQGIKDADVIVILRLQKERMISVYLPSEAEYCRLFGIDEDRLASAKPGVIIMHPGPLNRGVEISSAVADGPHSIILKQVSFGVAVRMAIMTLLLQPKINYV
jgi:aspartate carbamoyltransferase catalytic subunit